MAHDEALIKQLEVIQKQLVHMMGYLAGLQNWEDVSGWVQLLEQWIIAYESSYPTQRSFILPGKTQISAELDVTRTVCRRTEVEIYKN